MSLSDSRWREALDLAARAQAEVDRRGHHLRVLYETAGELSGLIQPRRIMETLLLTAMGTFGLGGGLVLMADTRTHRGWSVDRGLAPEEAEALNGGLENIAAAYLSDGLLGPHAEIVPPGGASDEGRLPAGTALCIRRAVAENYALLVALGGRPGGPALDETEVTTLLNLTGIAAEALAHNLFDRRFQHLSAGLARQSAELEQALAQAGEARANLDRRVFHLQTLYEFTAELSPLVATEKLLGTFLLMVMGAFGSAGGRVLLCDRKSGRVFSAARGAAPGPMVSVEEAQTLLYRAFLATAERSLAPMSAGFVAEPGTVLAGTDWGADARSALFFTVDESLQGLLVLAPAVGKRVTDAEERELLHGLTANFLVFLKNARAFETIQELNADLQRTIDELTEAHRRIRILELAKTRLKQFVRGEIERAGRMRPAHVLMIVLASSVLGLAFNASSPGGIPVLPVSAPSDSAPPVAAAELKRLMAEGRAVLVDARPPELFARRHIAGAVNVPAPLFDVIYPMKLGPVLKSEQEVAVYGRTFSRRYDAELIQRLLPRHERVRVLAGDLPGWQAQGLPVAP
jgi:rhodanese-related sulfurtransferase